MNTTFSFDLTDEYPSLDKIRATLDLIPDAWAYAIDLDQADGTAEFAYIFAMTGKAFYAPGCNLTLVRTLDECVAELGKLVGV